MENKEIFDTLYHVTISGGNSNYWRAFYITKDPTGEKLKDVIFLEKNEDLITLKTGIVTDEGINESSEELSPDWFLSHYADWYVVPGTMYSGSNY